jgi:hypothetical protein
VADLQLLREADMVLNTCGRLVPPAGYKFVDLPRVMNFFLNPPTGAGTPYQQRISNDADTLFICRGVGLVNSPSIRIRWPDGRFLSQNPIKLGNNDSPQGRGPQMLALMQERFIQPGGRVSLEFSGVSGGLVEVAFWGVLRYMMFDRTGEAGGGAADCIVGYAAGARTKKMAADAGQLLMMPDPVSGYAALPRIKCGPNQNLMAPEWMLGNQCTAETPADREDESFTFFSDPITVAANGQNFNNVVIVPGSDDVVIKNVLPFITVNSPLTFAIPTFALRLPNGYAVTGGDMVPTNLILGQGWPVFPTLRVRAGDRLILDFADMLASGDTGSTTTVLQFDCVKRRKKVAA